MAEKQKGNRPRRRREGYIHRSNAICVVVHDMNGKNIPEDVVTRIMASVTEIAKKNDLLINFSTS